MRKWECGMRNYDRNRTFRIPTSAFTKMKERNSLFSLAVRQGEQTIVLLFIEEDQRRIKRIRAIAYADKRRYLEKF